MSEDVRRLRVDNCIGFLWELLEKMTRRNLLIQPRAVNDFIRSLRTVQKKINYSGSPLDALRLIFLGDPSDAAIESTPTHPSRSLARRQ